MQNSQAGRPTKDSEHSRSELLQIRVDASEKEGFTQAAHLNGLGLSGWVRLKLRMEARRELQDMGRPVPFIT